MTEARFRAMGSDVHVIVVGGAPDLVATARARIDELEQRWSRFIDTSEVSELTRCAGSPVPVSDDTVALVTHATEGWRITGSTFDPTVLGAVLRAGYTRSFDELDDDTVGGMSDLVVVACTDIVVDGNSITLPAGTGFDPGGIGKGLAADLVVAEMLAAGAAGACVNIGGDLRAAGEPPEGEGWTIAIEHPWQRRPVANVGIEDGAVATSTTLRRRWRVNGEDRHHLIDPFTGAPAATGLNLVAVVAARAWTAEVLAKAVLIRGKDHPFDLIDGTGAEAMVVDDDGGIRVTEGFRTYLGFGWLPESLELDS